MTIYSFDRAMILAAGKGTRLRPHTDTMPKPLVPVAGVPIIDHVLNSLEGAGVGRVAVNLHYLGEMIETHLKRRGHPAFDFSWEAELLETGGGLKKALPLFEGRDVLAVAGDSFWTDGPTGNALSRMAAAWKPDRMDLLLLLQPLSHIDTSGARGDYDLVDGCPVRRHDGNGNYMWTSVRICAPRLFDDTPDGPFSFLALMDRAEQAGRLAAIVHDGEWHHISTPDDLARVDAHLRECA